MEKELFYLKWRFSLINHLFEISITAKLLDMCYLSKVLLGNVLAHRN